MTGIYARVLLPLILCTLVTATLHNDRPRSASIPRLISRFNPAKPAYKPATVLAALLRRQELCPIGSHGCDNGPGCCDFFCCGANGCCDAGELCYNGDKGATGPSFCCEAYVEKRCIDGCIPMESNCCDDGGYCDFGYACDDNGGCCPYGHTCTGNPGPPIPLPPPTTPTDVPKPPPAETEPPKPPPATAPSPPPVEPPNSGQVPPTMTTPNSPSEPSITQPPSLSNPVKSVGGPSSSQEVSLLSGEASSSFQPLPSASFPGVPTSSVVPSANDNAASPHAAIKVGWLAAAAGFAAGILVGI